MNKEGNTKNCRLEERLMHIRKQLGDFRRVNAFEIVPDLHRGEYAVLEAISILGENTKVSDITMYTGAPAPAISRTLKKLEERELVVRDVDINDRRNTFVKMTKKGKMLLDKSTETLNEFFAKVFTHMNDDDMENFIQGISKFLDAFSYELNEMKGDKK